MPETTTWCTRAKESWDAEWPATKIGLKMHAISGLLFVLAPIVMHIESLSEETRRGLMIALATPAFYLEFKNAYRVGLLDGIINWLKSRRSNENRGVKTKKSLKRRLKPVVRALFILLGVIIIAYSLFMLWQVGPDFLFGVVGGLLTGAYDTYVDHIWETSPKVRGARRAGGLLDD